MPDDSWSADVLKNGALDGFRDLLRAFEGYAAWPSLSDFEREWLVARQVTSSSGAPLRLVLQAAAARRARPRSRRDLYDVSVCNGQVPTRAHNWHDFFNVLVFAGFPRSKSVLHGRHRRVLEQRVPELVELLPGARTREQDHLAMLDEGGVLLALDSRNHEAITFCLESAQHEGLYAAIERGELRPWLFGHAHMEHLVKGTLSRVPMAMPRAKPVLLDVGVNATRDEVDAALATQLSAPTVEFLENDWRAISLEVLYGSRGQSAALCRNDIKK